MNNYPLVCICIPAFNAELTIAETINSLIRQSYRNIQIKILDNASTDSTVKVARSIKDPRIKIFESTVNLGAEENFNKCINVASGKYTVIFHADDIYEQSIIEEQVRFLEANASVGAVFTGARLIDLEGKKIGKYGIPKDIAKYGYVINFFDLFRLILKMSNFLICPSAMVRTNIYKFEVKKWRFNLFKSSSDLDVWLRISKKHALGFLDKPLINYRISNQQGSAIVRSSFKKADFFLVTEFYLANLSKKEQLQKRDILNYEILSLRDDLVRSLNLIRSNQAEASRKIIFFIFTRKWFQLMLNSWKGLLLVLFNFFLIVAILMKLFVIFKYAAKMERRFFNSF